MNIFTLIYQTFLYNPISAMLVYFYQATGNNLGLAIILLTIIIKIVLMPFEQKALRSQREMAEIQPKLEEIQRRYKDDKEKQAEELMNLYKEAKINPFAGISILFLQLPVLISLYQVIRTIAQDPSINTMFLGFISLKEPYMPLVVLVAFIQYLQISITMTKSQKKTQGWMAIFSPALLFFVLLNFLSAVSLYIITSSLFTIGEQYFINKKKKENHEPKN
jgi:YidC/Oxa1 family membrane protein insertase